MPKVSIVMPSLNVAEYILECIDSVRKQSLADIEIICVDAGSTDGTLEILEQSAKNDSRVILLKSDIRSYGHQVNLGVKQATGEFIGIVETDDFVPENMYQRLYNVATSENVQIVKANFSRFYGDAEERTFEPDLIASKKEYYNCLLNPQETPELLTTAFYTWAGIYKRDFLLKNDIWHNESPGASYQDNGFYFQTLCCAEKMYLIEDDLYKLRRDNPNSSTANTGKVWAFRDECKFMYNFLAKDPVRKQRFLAGFWYNKFVGYSATFKRIAYEHKLEFLKHWENELVDGLLSGEVRFDYFTKKHFALFRQVVAGHEEYFYTNIYNEDNLPLPRSEKEEIANIQHMHKGSFYKTKNTNRQLRLTRNSPEYKIGRVIFFIPRTIIKGLQKIKRVASYIKSNGFLWTGKQIAKRIVNR